MSYCANPQSFDMQIYLKNAVNGEGALAYEQFNMAGTSGSIGPIQSLVYSRGWPGFDSSSQANNRLYIDASTFICTTSFTYQAKYIAFLAPFNTYSNLACISVNPFTIGIEW
jgi:hypothetical protein